MKVSVTVLGTGMARSQAWVERVRQRALRRLEQRQSEQEARRAAREAARELDQRRGGGE